jgi:paraquat-inducible protein B
MTDTPASTPPVDELPQPVVRQRRRINPSLIWLVPILAALAGVALILRAYLAAGPTITIRFPTAEGIEAGKTEVRYKNVVMGKVRDVELAEDRSHVRARVNLSGEAAGVAVEDSQFWVVRVRADLGGISGFNTLVSGTYIGVNIGRSETRRLEFDGLEKPPTVTNDQKGRQFVLKTPDLGSLNVGSPVYFRRIPVGRIAGFELDEDGRGLTVRAFVDEPYDRYVTADARFWNASGVDLSLDASGLKLNTQSLVTLVAGGVAFQPLSGEIGGKAADEGASFTLYTSQDAALTAENAWTLPVRMRFTESIRGLAVDAPVDFKGIGIGRVTAIELSFDREHKRFVAEVAAEIRPQRLGRAYRELAADHAPDARGAEALFAELIERGLRAQLRAGNLITGQLYVALDFPPKAKALKVDTKDLPLLIPTEPASLDQIQTRISDIVNKVGNRLRDALGAADALLRQLDAQVAPAATETLREARSTLDAANRSLASPDAPLQQDMRRTLEEVDRAARSLRDLSDYLQRHPDALIRGRRQDQETPSDE